MKHKIIHLPVILLTAVTSCRKHIGTFVFANIAPGKYAVTVVNLEFFYGKYQLLVALDEVKMVDITPGGTQKQGQQVQTILKRTKINEKPLVFEPKGKLQYFEQRQQVNIMSFFMNPMMIMMFVSVGLMWLMPKMMENLSPEELKEAQEKMAKQQNPNEVFNNLFGGKKQNDDDSDVE